MADPPCGRLTVFGLLVADDVLLIDGSPTVLAEVTEVVSKERGGKVPGARNISAQMLRAGGKAMNHGMLAVLTAVYQSTTIPLNWRRGLVISIWNGKGDSQDCKKCTVVIKYRI